MPPFVSVIIPTAGRPQWLPRSVKSALSGMPPGEVEVLVIANGPDTSWQQSLASWSDCPFVRAYALPNPNQNEARNYGLAQAKGELVRFLDDDDYLFPEAAAQQYTLMREENIDVCSGPVEIRDESGTRLATLSLPGTSDFRIGALQHGRLQLVFAHVYRRSSLSSVEWPTNILRSEDIIFLMRYALAAPRTWKKVTKPVGVWYQHQAPRMSLGHPTSAIHESTARELLAAHAALALEGDLSRHTSAVIAEALWQCIHSSFYLRPMYWTRVAQEAMRIDADARPTAPFFQRSIVKSLNPILLHWIALPIRLCRHAFRLGRARRHGWDYRRTL